MIVRIRQHVVDSVGNGAGHLGCHFGFLGQSPSATAADVVQQLADAILNPVPLFPRLNQGECVGQHDVRRHGHRAEFVAAVNLGARAVVAPADLPERLAHRPHLLRDALLDDKHQHARQQQQAQRPAQLRPLLPGQPGHPAFEKRPEMNRRHLMQFEQLLHCRRPVLQIGARLHSDLRPFQKFSLREISQVTSRVHGC